MVRRDKANYTIQSVSHALDVLEQFTGEPDELGVTELSKRLKLHKNNVFRLLATLESRGYIEQNKTTENYRLGVRCLRLGQRFLLQASLLRQAQPVLNHLAETSGETVFIAVLQDDVAVVLDAVEPARAVRLIAKIGDLMPLHCTAVGKALLTFSETVLLGEISDYQRYTPATKCKPNEVRVDLNRASERGYTVELGEHVDDVCAVAVPIRDYTGTVVAALCVAGPVHRLPQLRLETEFAEMVLAAGRVLSARLGHHTD